MKKLLLSLLTFILALSMIAAIPAAETMDENGLNLAAACSLSDDCTADSHEPDCPLFNDSDDYDSDSLNSPVCTLSEDCTAVSHEPDCPLFNDSDDYDSDSLNSPACTLSEDCTAVSHEPDCPLFNDSDDHDSDSLNSPACTLSGDCTAVSHEPDCPLFNDSDDHDSDSLNKSTCTLSEDCTAVSHEPDCPLFNNSNKDTRDDTLLSDALKNEESQTLLSQNSLLNNETQAIFVSKDGQDEGNTEGSLEAPFATLAKAVDFAQDGATIYVMTDLQISALARITNKHLTITSYQDRVTITRGNNFTPASDDARSFYNHAIFEVTTIGDEASDNASSVTLENIILDDDGKFEGTLFSQAISGEGHGNNMQYVQDAMIAGYGLENRTVHIILGDGAVLRNYGGMSAVRAAGNAVITMQGGSIIEDGDEITNRDGDSSGTDNGPAGAVWIQGAAFIMEENARIENLIGRGVYVDSGEINLGGTFENIVPSAGMWQGAEGFVLHLRNGGTAILTGTCFIDNEKADKAGTAIKVEACQLTVEENAVISNCVTGIAGQGDCTITFHGIIRGLYGPGEPDGIGLPAGHAITLQGHNADFTLTIGANAQIYDNISWYGTVYVQGGDDAEVHIYGKINQNVSTDRGGALAMSNNYQRLTAYLYPGAEICDNTSYQSGGGILVSKGTFIMEGGTISSNISGANTTSNADKVGGGVHVRRDGIFIMKDGTISNNVSASVGGGIAFDSGSTATAQLLGGTIAENHQKAAVVKEDHGYTPATEGEYNDIAITGSSAANLSRYLSVSSDVALDNEDIYLEKYDFYIQNPANDIKLGNGSSSCESAVTSALNQQNLTHVIGSFWYQTENENFALQGWGLDDNTDYKADKPLYAAVIATNADGTPVNQATVQLYMVSPDTNHHFHLSLPGVNENGYAVVFVQEGEVEAQIITIMPADITIYMGSDGGYEAVVDASGIQTSSNSLPEPGYFIILPASLNDQLQGADLSNGKLTFTYDYQNEQRTWTLNRYGIYDQYNGITRYVYGLVSPEGQQPVLLQFTNQRTGQAATNDTFMLSTELLSQDFTISIYPGTLDQSQIQAVINGQTYTTAIGTGILTVRGTTTENPNTTSIAAEEAQVAGNQIRAVAPASVTYYVNDSGVAIDVTNNPERIQLLADEEPEEFQTTLTNYIATDDTYSGYANGYHLEYKYLDLVDTQNGNTVVTLGSGQALTLYWPLPDNVRESSIAVLHFVGLDRENNSLQDIVKLDASLVTINGQRYAKFMADSFSPFALVYQNNQSSSSSGNSGSGGNTVYYTIMASAEEGGSISPDGTIRVPRGNNRTFTITADEGYEIADVIVDGERVGAITSYTFQNIRDDHTIKVIFKETIKLDTINHNPFLYGYPDGTFGCGSNMTRAEAAQMFYNLLLEKDVAVTVSFVDVPSDAWYATAVNTLASLHILEGIGNNQFAPNQAITRAEFTAIAMRFTQLDAIGENIFTDVNEDDWFYEQVISAVNYGWIAGYGDGTFRPNHSITRAEVSVITNGLLNRTADKDYIDTYADQLRQFSDLSRGHWAYYHIMEATNAHTYEKDNDAETWIELF